MIQRKKKKPRRRGQRYSFVEKIVPTRRGVETGGVDNRERLGLSKRKEKGRLKLHKRRKKNWVMRKRPKAQTKNFREELRGKVTSSACIKRGGGKSSCQSRAPTRLVHPEKAKRNTYLSEWRIRQIGGGQRGGSHAPACYGPLIRKRKTEAPKIIKRNLTLRK